MRFQLPRVTGVIIMAILSVFTGSCVASGSSSLTSGALIWGSGNKIYQWSGKTGKRTTLLTLPYGATITGLTNVNSMELLFSASQVPAGMAVYPDNIASRIYIFNLKTRKVAELLDGLAPTYVRDHHKLFFLGQGEGLFVANLQSSEVITNVKKIHASGIVAVGEIPGSVMQVASDEVIFDYDPLNGVHQVLEYNLKANEWKALPIAGCRPVLWRTATQQLLCTKGDSFDYYLADLQDKHVKEIGRLHPIVFFLYLPGLDAAFATRPGAISPPERDDTWIYYFKTGKWMRIIKGAQIAPGTAVWINYESTRHSAKGSKAVSG